MARTETAPTPSSLMLAGTDTDAREPMKVLAATAGEPPATLQGADAAAAVAATPALVQVTAATPQTNQSRVAFTYTGAQVAGNTNIVVIGWNNATSAITSVTDTAGNTYRQAGTTARGSGVSQAIYYASNIKVPAAGPTKVTTTFNTATPFVDIRALEYSGLDPNNPLNVVKSASGTGKTANSGTVTTTAANALIFGAGTTQGDFSAGGTNFTTRIITTPNANIAEDRIVTTAGPYGATASLRSSAAWVMQVAAFKAANDTTAPTVSVTAPSETVSGMVTLSATASDNVGVADVQFLVDGAELGLKDPAAPYSVSWDTTQASNGTHRLTAVARDAAGNTATSTAVDVTVANAPQTTISVGTNPVAVAVAGVNGSRAYVSNYSDNTVSVIDTNTNIVIKTISVGSSPRALAASPDGSRVYVTNQNANTVSVIDTSTNMVVDTIAVPVERPGIGRFSYVYDVAVSPDGRYVYVTGTAGSGFTSTDGTVSVINTTTRAVSGPFAAGPAATGIAVSPDGSRLYVATELWNSNITVMDTAAMTVIGTVFVGESYYPIDGAFTPNGERLYMITGVQGEAAQTNGPTAVMVIDTDPTRITTYNTVIAGFSDYDLFGGDFDAPSDVTISPDGSRAYVVGTGGNKIAVIDTSTNAVVGHITTNLSQYDGSRHIAISPDGNTLYVTDSAADSVVTVSVASMTPTAL